MKENKKNKKKKVEILFLNLHFVCFLAFLTMLQIANAHYAEKNMLRVQNLKNEIKEVKWQYVDVQNKIMYGSTESQLVKKLKYVGLRENRSVPNKIILE